MKEEYVSYECAVKLKELGFDWKVEHSYTDVIKESAREEWDEEECQWSTVYDCNSYPKPRLDQAQKWLRDCKDMDVLVFNNACGFGWEISKSNSDSRGTTIALFDDKGNDKDSGMWLSYELALSAGIDKALEFLTIKKAMENGNRHQ